MKQRGTIRESEFHIPDRKIVLSFLAHPDDAEVLCAGTLIRLADAGWDVHIATATAGDCGSATLPAHEIASIRRNEAAAAAKCIGATYHCLEERDVNVVFDRAAYRKAIDLFRQVAPSLVFTHPRHDYMLHHEQVHLLARGAAFHSSVLDHAPPAMVTGPAATRLYYCDPEEARDPYTGEPARASVWINVTSVMTRKIEMLACHASQREWLRSHHGMDEYIDAMKQHSAIRGREIGVEYAEAFVQHQGHAYPQTNLLKELIGKES